MCMREKQSAEFGENGAVLNSDDMTPERRAAYAGEVSSATGKIDIPWWVALPGLIVVFASVKVFNELAPAKSRIEYWVALAGFIFVMWLSACIITWALGIRSRNQ